MADQWYIKTKNGKKGPYSVAQLQRYVDAGAVRPNAGISDGVGPWRAAISLDALVFSEEAVEQLRAAIEAKKSGIGQSATPATKPDAAAKPVATPKSVAAAKPVTLQQPSEDSRINLSPPENVSASAADSAIVDFAANAKQAEELERQQQALQERDAELQSLRDTLAVKQAGLEKQESELADRETELEQLAQSLRDQETDQLREAEEKRQQVQQELVEVREKFDELQIENAQVVDRLATAEAKNKELQEKLDQQEVELKDQKDELSQQEVSIKALDEQIDSVQEKVCSLEQTLENADSKLAQAETDRQTLESRLEELQSLLDEEQSKRKVTEEQLRELEGSIAVESSEPLAETDSNSDVEMDQLIAEKQELLEEFAARQESLSRREAELSQRESELARREQDLSVEVDLDHSPAHRATEVGASHAGLSAGDTTVERALTWDDVLSGGANDEVDDDSVNDVSSLGDDDVDNVASTEVPVEAEAPEFSADSYVEGSDSGGDAAGVAVDVASSWPIVAPAQAAVPTSIQEPAAVNETQSVGEETPISFPDFRRQMFNERFGPCSDYYIDEDPTMHVDVSVHPPGNARDFSTLVTSGMSDYPIPMPNGQRSVRAELLLYATQVDETAIEVLRAAAKIPYRKKHGLAIGTTGSLGETDKPISTGNQKDCVYMLPVVESDSKPIPAKEIVGSSIQLFWLVTITEAERKLIEQSGIHKFLSLLEKNNHAVFFDLTRDCYVKRRSWFRR